MIRALSISGPTASGKTALSLSVAEKMGCEIISCDSMQIYRGMDIGTAKATPEERARVPHHLIDMISPSESYSAESYRADAMTAAREIVERGNIPLFVGGTGLYLDTVARGADHVAPGSDPAVRMRLTEEAEREGGADRLYDRLCKVDPEAAEKIHKNNIRRVIRALEIYESTGMTKTEADRLSSAPNSEIEISRVTLDFSDRELLYRRVDTRVDKMIEEGLVGEVEGLLSAGLLHPDTTAAQAIGYKEIAEYLAGRRSLESAIEEIKLNSRRYAKRQLTWFRHTDAHRLTVDAEGSMRNIDDICSEAIAYFTLDGEII